MRKDLLICAAVDLSGRAWPERQCERMTASLKLGLAGDISQGDFAGGFWATRRDSVPGVANPRISRGGLAAAPDGAITLLAGQLFEPDELCRKLGIARPESHASLYAAAYGAFGERCDAEVVGQYAAFQFFPASNRVRLARSPLNAPPLHLWRHGSQLIAASLPRSIFAAGVAPELDPDRLADVALLNFGDGRASYYRGLSRVACGWVEQHWEGGQEAVQSWSPGDLPKAKAVSAGEAVSTSRELLDRAVSAHMRSSRKPAISLSGGLDSQAVGSAMLAQLGEGERLRSYTSVPVADWHGDADERLCTDERPSVEALGAMYPALDAAFVEARQERFAQDLDRLFTIGSWPSFNEMNMHWVHAIHRSARADGCDALFTGDYGDPGLSYDGLTGFSTWLRKGQFGRLWRELRAFDDPRSLPRRAASHAILPLLPVSVRERLDRRRGFAVSPFESWSPLDPRGANGRRSISRLCASRGSGWRYRPASATASRADMLAPGQSEGPEIDLAMRLLHGVPTREPLAFRPLFEYVASLPDEMFLRQGTSRWLAREVVRGRVPDAVSDETRVAVQSSDFFDRLRRWSADMIGSIAAIPRGSIARQVIDLDRIARDLDDHRRGRDLRPYRWYRLASAAPRGIVLARFAQYVEGRNDGG